MRAHSTIESLTSSRERNQPMTRGRDRSAAFPCSPAALNRQACGLKSVLSGARDDRRTTSLSPKRVNLRWCKARKCWCHLPLTTRRVWGGGEARGESRMPEGKEETKAKRESGSSGPAIFAIDLIVMPRAIASDEMWTSNGRPAECTSPAWEAKWSRGVEALYSSRLRKFSPAGLKNTG